MKTLAQSLMLATFSYLCRAQCIVEYTEQPPTTIDCSPYDTLQLEQQFTLRTACVAKNVGNGDFDNLDLFWYRKRSSDGVEENLGTGTESQELPNGNKRIVLQGISGLNQAPFSEEMPGDYWCQAVITNSSGQYLLTESNVLPVLRPENYTGKSVCNSVQSEFVETCASGVQLLSGSSSSSISPTLSSLLPSLSLSTSPITMAVTSSQSYKSPAMPTGVSATPVVQVNEISAVLVAIPAAVGGVAALMLAIVLVVIAVMRCTNRKQQQGLRDRNLTVMDRNQAVTDRNVTTMDRNLPVTDRNFPVTDGNQTFKDKKQGISDEPAYQNPHYFEAQNHTKKTPGEDHDEVNVDRFNSDPANGYKSLNLSTIDYESMYSRPGEWREKHNVPTVEVGGKLYAIVNKDKTEQHIYISLEK